MSLLQIKSHSRRSLRHLFILSIIFASYSFNFSPTPAQIRGGSELTGTGGIHTIQGRIFFPSGPPSGEARLKVQLETSEGSTLSTLTASDGSFRFGSLLPGTYTLVVDVGGEFEVLRESLFIDRDKLPRVLTVPLYLREKVRGRAGDKPGVINAALAGVPAEARTEYEKALAATRNGQGVKAIEHLRAAVSLFPNFALAYNELGVQYLKLGQPEKAAEALRHAVRLAPDSFTPRLNYGIALLNKKEFREAETELREAVRKNNLSPTAHMYLGITLMSLKQMEEAEKELRRAIESGSRETSLAHYYLGGILWGKGLYKQAADELETYLKLNPNAADSARLRTTVKELRSKQ
jgi:Flp pilus assembly protein TadD